MLMEMGTGKTITSISISGALYQAGRIRKVLVVAPLSILGVWQEEFETFANFDYSLSILSGSTQKKAAALRQMQGSALQIAVVNYESAWRMETELLRFAPDLVIADEGHKIKTHNIAAAKAMHRLGAKSAYRLLLTGTVITNKAIDVFSQYKFLNPGIYGNSFYAFRNRYFDMVGYGNHTPVLKQSMKSELTQKLHSIAFRATKAECLDLPNTIDIVRHVELEPSARKLYRDLVKESYADLGKGEVTVTNVLTRLLRLSQLTGGFIGENDSSAIHAVSEAKLQALADIAETAINENQKLVIIARFVPELEAICKYLDRYSTSQDAAGESISCYSLIKGGVQNRAEQVRRFQNDPNVHFFVGQIATAGLGITLTAAKTMVFYSLDYSMSNCEQTKARIHRVGQKQDCTYLYLTARDTVDEKVLKALRQKANLAKTLVDDYRKGRNPFVQEDTASTVSPQNPF